MSKHPENTPLGDEFEELNSDSRRRMARIVIDVEGTAAEIEAVRAHIGGLEQQIPGRAGEEGVKITEVQSRLTADLDYPLAFDPTPTDAADEQAIRRQFGKPTVGGEGWGVYDRT